MPFKKLHIQLYVDECFPVTSVTHLRSLGYSIIHAYDRNFIRKSDKFHFNISKKLNMVLITLDRDFIAYEKMPLGDHPGIIIISLGSAVSDNVNKVCKKFFQRIGEDFAKNAVIKVTQNKIIKSKNGRMISEMIL